MVENTGFGEPSAGLKAVDQLDSKPGFESADMATDDGMMNPKRLRGAAQTPGARDRLERSQGRELGALWSLPIWIGGSHGQHRKRLIHWRQ